MAKFKKCPRVLKSRSKDTHIIFHDAPILAASVYFRKVDMIFASKAANSRSGKNTAVCIHHLRCYFRRCSSSAGSSTVAISSSMSTRGFSHIIGDLDDHKWSSDFGNRILGMAKFQNLKVGIGKKLLVSVFGQECEVQTYLAIVTAGNLNGGFIALNFANAIKRLNGLALCHKPLQ
jgi:hypothetical protein